MNRSSTEDPTCFLARLPFQSTDYQTPRPHRMLPGVPADPGWVPAWAMLDEPRKKDVR